MNTRAVTELLAKHPRLWILAGVGGVFIAISSAKKIFDGWEGFLEALRFWFQPGWLSLLRREFWQDVKAEVKLFIWFLGSLIVILLLKIGITKLVVTFSLVERFNLPI